MERFSNIRHYSSATLLLGLLALATQAPAYADTLIANTSGTTPLNGIAPLTVKLSGENSVCIAPGYSCRWHYDFGDGMSSNPDDDFSGARDATHHYLLPGTYTATQTVKILTPTNPQPTATAT